MGTLEDRLHQDMITAMKARDTVLTTTLRMGIGALKNEKVAGHWHDAPLSQMERHLSSLLAGCPRDAAYLGIAMPFIWRSLVHAALKPGSTFILTALNGLRMARKHTQDDVESGVFDPITMTNRNTLDYETPDGKRTFVSRERGYVPTELRFLARTAGFEVLHIWGGTAGNWGRRAIDLDEMEIMMVARKR